MGIIEGYADFTFSILADAFAFESMLQENEIEYHKRDGQTAYHSYVTFYVKEEEYPKVNKLWENRGG
ncbi:hypothetical protein ACFL96_15760 [Thermoproteota archaeon]